MKIVFFFFILMYSNLYSQWVRLDSVSNLSTLAFPNTGMRIGEGGDSWGECDLPIVEGKGKLIYHYFIRNDRSDLVYFQLVDEEKNAIISTGFYRLIYVSKDYSKNLLKAIGNILLCWEKDMVWTYFKDGKIINEFYDAGVLKELNAIDAFPYPRKKN